MYNVIGQEGGGATTGGRLHDVLIHDKLPFLFPHASSVLVFFSGSVSDRGVWGVFSHASEYPCVFCMSLTGMHIMKLHFSFERGSFWGVILGKAERYPL